MICASEDVGNADPQALSVAVAAAQAVERVGMPEAQIILSQAVLYVATAPKSNSAVNAISAAMENVRNYKTTVPAHLRDGHYQGAKKLGRSTGYRYAHDYPHHYVRQQYLPDEILGTRFYEPGDNGKEKEIKAWMEFLKGSDLPLFVFCYLFSRIRPSMPMVTTCQGMNRPLAFRAWVAACSRPPQQGTSMRTMVRLLIEFWRRIWVSFSV